MNFPACSGATTSDVVSEQFRNIAGFDVEYGLRLVLLKRFIILLTSLYSGERPQFGNPAFATLTIGGDDIDFVNLVRNCIYDILPWQSCDDQLKDSWAKIKDPALVNSIYNVIQQTLQQGRNGTAGDDFQLFVTGYAEFFNAESPQCSNITWSVLPWPFGNQQKLTTGLRETLNSMSKELNKAISAAVFKSSSPNVKYIDWEQGSGALNGHRYCEPGVTEPGHSNPNLWFWQYPQSNLGDPNNGIGITDPDELAFKDIKAQLWDPSVKTMVGFRGTLPSKEGRKASFCWC